MKQLILIPLLLFTITGCGPSNNNNIKNACLEMGQTSVGFTGPSKRMDIMKSYGMTLETASTYNEIVGMYSGLLNEAKKWNFKNSEACLKKAFSCQEMLGAVINVDMEYVEEFALEIQKCPGKM